MTDATQPRTARGTKLTVGVMAAALFALLAFAPFASAAADPVGSGSTTITLKSGVVKSWKKKGVTIKKVSPATLKGTKATFPVNGGSLDPTTGAGTVTHTGGLKFKAGKKTATVKDLVVDTTTKSVTANVAGKKMKLATIAGSSFVRNGFGVNLTVKALKLTSKAAKQLNKKLGYTAKKGKKKGKASASKGTSAPFKGNQAIGSAASETQPTTVTVLPGGDATLALSASAVQKLQEVGPPPGPGPGPFSVQLSAVPPTTAAGVPPTLTFPIGGGTLSPVGAAGTLQTLGGVKLVQSLEAAPPPGTRGVTTLTLGNIWVDMSTKQATVEVIIENPKTPAANLGNLGRVSIADVNLTGATIASDAANHTISVQNASATLQAVTAETLNAVFISEIEKATGEPQNKFAAGDPLGVFSFTAKTQ
jgi:hypothetical protein